MTRESETDSPPNDSTGKRKIKRPDSYLSLFDLKLTTEDASICRESICGELARMPKGLGSNPPRFSRVLRLQLLDGFRVSEETQSRLGTA
jgi:hypothetical protein